MRKYKLISLGNNQSNFITQLYRAVKQTGLPIEITVDDYHQLGDNCDFEQQSIIDHFIHIEDFSIAKKIALADILTFISKKFWVDFFLRSTYSKVNVKSYFVAAIRKSIIKRTFFNQNKYDIYHFHSCISSTISYIELVPPNAKIICSFWGSDLLMNDGMLNYYNLTNALNRADIITVQNREMKEMLLVKHGRSLTHKVKLALFPSEQRIYNTMDTQISENNGVSKFKNSLGISNDKIIIVVGHNANPNDQHIKILSALNKLDKTTKQSITIVLPFTYGNAQKEKYIQEIKTKFESSDLELVFIVDFLDWEDLALLRLATDYLIHMPIFDALSSVIIETMYGGGHVLAACWLPYGKYRRLGLHFDEIENFIELTTRMEKLLETNPRNNDKDKTLSNQSIIQNTFFEQPTSLHWKNIYTKLLGDDMAE